jgi:surface polysaccharide O-acyltransferase-like enzyme
MKIFNDKIYNVLKYLAMIALPALAVFIKAFFPIWNIPYGDQISDSIMVINALLGTLLGISTIGYQKTLK